MDFILISKVAETFGLHIETVRRWVRQGELAAYNISLSPTSKKPRLAFKIADLEAFLERRRVSPTEQMPRRMKRAAKAKPVKSYV